MPASARTTPPTVQGGISGSNGPWSYSLGLARIPQRRLQRRRRCRALPHRQWRPAQQRRRRLPQQLAARRAALQTRPGPRAPGSILEAGSRNAFDSGGVATDAYNPTRPVRYGLQLRNRRQRSLDIDPAPGATARTTAAASPRHAASSPPAEAAGPGRTTCACRSAADAGAGEPRPGRHQHHQLP
jgi:hypothetical protein